MDGEGFKICVKVQVPSIPGLVTSTLQTSHHKYLVLTGLLDMLTRAQCCRVDDQRGLLTKEQLEVPLFLQLSSDQRKEDTDPETGAASSNNEELDEIKKEAPAAPGSAGAAVEAPDSAQAKPADLRETSV